MRVVVYGAGAIGGTIGGRLFQSGHDVVLIARGSHLDAIRDRGLLLRAPDGDFRLPVPAVGHPSEVDWRKGDVVVLAMKTQDTEAALRDLELAADPGVPVVCAQNGVENERLAARRFEGVYAMLVALPATFLESGVVIASAAPLSGCLHAGRYPRGTDDIITELCTALRASRFTSEPDERAMELKHRKLILNLGNAVEVITHRQAWGAGGELGAFMEQVRAEATRCYAAAGITSTAPEEYARRVTAHYSAQPVGGEARAASSTWQSVLRGHPTVEVDYLNGEIELLGALHGVLTPLNSLIRREAVRAAAAGASATPLSLAELQRMANEAVAAAK